MFQLNSQWIFRILFVFAFFVSSELLATELPEFKFGKISINEIVNAKFEQDSGAHAFFLFDTGTSIIDYDNTSAFKIVFTRHLAIKILTNSGYKHASFEIPLYKTSNNPMEEKITKIKALTYNADGGKLSQTSLDKKDIFTVNENENLSKVKFTMPNVKEGSVVEIEYTLTSDFLWNLPTWLFQHEIPVRWSILDIRIPEYFNYSKEMKGYVSLFHSENKTLNGVINFFNVDKIHGNQGTTNQMSISKVNYNIYQSILGAKDIPAFYTEPYTDAPANYLSSISFELETTSFPNQKIKNYTTTWEQIGSTLNNDDKFGKQLPATNISKEKTAELQLDSLSETDKLKTIFNYVKTITKWDGKNSKYCDNVRQVLKNGVGNSGDINILLINLIDAAGFEVYPVLLKTRSAGKLPITHPSLSSLNYVIAAVKSEGKTYLLDATEDELPFNLIPDRCLNGKAILLKPNDQIEWIELNDNGFAKNTTFANFKIDSEGQIDAKLNVKSDGHYAVQKREKLYLEKDQIVKNFEEKHSGFKVNIFDIKNLDKPDEILEELIEGTISDKVTTAGNMVYFNPCIFEKTDENPFKIDDRKYPVDFGYPIDSKTIFTYEIPSGWIIESLPTALSIKLPNNAGKYIYNIQQVGGKIILSQSFAITNPFFLPAGYATLKEFFKQMVDKQQEQIVFKKTA